MFDVRWEDTAVNELALIWVEGDSATRDLITDAVHRMDYRLKSDPLSMSESRLGGRRIAFLSPIGILFRIEADEQTVSVLHVWLFRKRGQN